MSAIKFVKKQVTPELAHKMLKNHATNRHPRANHIRKLASDMFHDRWEQNGETLKINEKGELIDGQHRLHALIESGKTIEFTIAKNVPECSIHTIDQGASRGIHDSLKIKGFASSTTLTTVYRLVARYTERGVVTPHRSDRSRTASEALEFIDKHPRLQQSVDHFGNRGSFSFMPVTQWMAMHFLLKPEHSNDLDIFFRRVNEGLEIPKYCPSMHLRNEIMRRRMEKRLGGAASLFYLLTTYWNEFLEGNKLKRPIQRTKNLQIAGARFVAKRHSKEKGEK